MIDTQPDTPDTPEAPDAPRRQPWYRRRTTIAAAVAVVALAVTVGFLTERSRDRPPLRLTGVRGIDVSHYQGTINWTEVASGGISFAYIKATEGGNFVDPRFAENWAGAEAAGLSRGAYHFFTLCSSGAEQAANFLNNVPVESDALPPALDLELSGNCAARPPASSVEQEVGAFLQQVEAATGTQVVIYVRDDFEKRYPVREWFARPQWRSGPHRRSSNTDWMIWQLGSGPVSGISGHVDLDVMRRPNLPTASPSA